MKLVSWNVNGLRACVQKGFLDFFFEQNADIFAIQETKMQPEQLQLDLPGYFQYFNSAIKKGYSGTAVFTKTKPIEVTFGIEQEHHDQEGRVITCEFEDFYFVTVYTPNSKTELERLEYRMQWEIDFQNYLLKLDQIKPVILCGDLNVAHQEIDLKNPSSNRRSAGFTDEERAQFSQLLATGFIDTFRYLYPNKTGAYTWWSYMNFARKNNAGWRIDYFVISERLKLNIEDSLIYPEILGSDHCPVGLIIK